MGRSTFYAALVRDVGSEWRPPVRPSSDRPPALTKASYSAEAISVTSIGKGERTAQGAAGGLELAKIIGQFAADVVSDVHFQRTQDLAKQVGNSLPSGLTLQMVPDAPPTFGWDVSSSYSLYPTNQQFLTPGGDVEQTQVTGSAAPPPSGSFIPDRFRVTLQNGEEVTINIPSHTASDIEDRGVPVRSFDLQQQRVLPADARFDARDQEPQHDFDVGRDPGGDDRFRDYEGDIRPGREIA
jgi:hypothetical protein